jgi:diacylglycerol O-acyltransferase-1
LVQAQSVSSRSLDSLYVMSAINRRTQRVVTDSEDDFVEIRQRQRHDLQLSRRSQTPPIAEKDEDETKTKSKRKPISNTVSIPYIHTAPIHVISKPSVLSKEAPPVEGGYHGFIRLGSKLVLLITS